MTCPPLWQAARGALLLATVGLAACQGSPSTSQLEAWKAEAIAENTRLMQTHAKTSLQAQWNLVVQGQTSHNKPHVLDWQTLEALATTHVRTKEPYPSSTNTVFDFRGVLVSTLLDRVGVAPNVKTVTFVAQDAYRSTISIEDLRRYPIVLAIARDDEPISRSEGGPLYLVMPDSQHPELKKRYTDSSWVFYVTHMIVGKEPIAIQVRQSGRPPKSKRTLTAADFDRLPTTTVRTPVGYRVAWNNGNVTLKGVRLQEALSAAGVPLTDHSTVLVRGKAASQRDDKSTRLTARELRSCEIILARYWGEVALPIPAKMGGPVTLAYSPNCLNVSAKEQPWTTFVEELEIQP